MKRFLLVVILLVVKAISQTGTGGLVNKDTGGVQSFVGVPTGTCSATQTAINTNNGNFYTCNGGVWTLSGGTSLPFTPLIQYAMINCTANVSCPDTSGNGNNGTLTNGVVNSKGLSFSTTTANISISPSLWASVRTILIWYKSVPQVNQSANTIQTLWSTGFTNIMMIRSTLGNVGIYNASPPETMPTQTQLGDSFMGWVAGSPSRMYFGPSEVSAYLTQGNNTPSGVPSDFRIGSETPGNGEFNGQMYYFLAFTQALTSAQVAQAYNFVNPILQARGISINPPINPINLHVGDSETECVAESNEPCWVSQVSRLTGRSASNLGIIGQTLSGYPFSTIIDPIIVPYSTTMILFLGANDLGANSATTGAQVYALFQSACSARRALGAASMATFDQAAAILNGTNVQYSVTVVNAPSYQARIAVYQEGVN